ncbi:MAG: DNA repair protein RecO [Candidatus Eiseniibacteriota bacterium]|nr:MAG: DNA repair protein RecO [Candidatus Eisenbacteria bacterium]
MGICKSEAVVTRSIRLGETSKIVWLYTKDFGRVKAVAKGARSPKNRFGSSLELFTHCSVVFYCKERRDLQLLSQSDTLRHFSILETDVARFAFASACFELLDTMVVGEDSNPPLFQLLLDTLGSFEECPKQGLRSVFWAFELKAAELLGYKPELFRCCRCDKEGELKRFAPLKGGLVCRACGLREPDSFEISPAARELLRTLQSRDISEAGSQAPVPRLEGEVDRVLEVFLQFHVDRLPGLKSLRLLKSLR